MASERKFVIENIRRALLKEYIRHETERAGFGGLDIQRTPMGTRIILTAERPGMIIGRKGGTIKELTENIETRFHFDNPRIEVQEDPDPALNPHIMAQKLASALERGWHFRRAGHSTVQRIMDAGARGCQVVISGKLTGERHRTEKFREGHVKYCGETKKQWMHDGFAVAKKKPGVIGIKVQIMDKNARLPDEVRIITLEEKLKMDGKSIPIPGAPEAPVAPIGAKPAEPGVPVPEGTAPAAPAKPIKEIDIAEADVGEVLGMDEKDLKAKKPVLPSTKRPPRGRNKPAKIPDKPEGAEAVKPPEPKHPPAPQPKVEPKPEVKPKPEIKPVPTPKVEPKPEVKPAPVAPVQPEKPPVAPTPEAKPADKKKSEDLDDLLSKLEKDLK
jgi:small subunit ribosomal protein S3